MRLEYLSYLIEIDKQHSISSAARELYMGQTTLSSILKGLESELGFPIFNRTHSGVVTTAEGEEALSLAWEIVSRFEEIKQINHHSTTVSQPVTLLTSPSISCSLSLPLSKAFLALEPRGNLTFAEATGGEVGPKIIQNDANIGLTYFLEDIQSEYQATAAKYQIQVERLFPDHLYLLMHQDHPLAKRKTVSASELLDMQFAMLSHFNTNQDSLFFSKSLSGRNRFTTFSSIPLIKRAVVEQNMLGVLSGYAIHYDHSTDNRCLRAVLLSDLSGENTMNLCLIHRSIGNLRYLEKMVLKCIEEHFAQLPPPPFSPEALGSSG